MSTGVPGAIARWLTKHISMMSHSASWKHARVLFITEPNRICQSQIFPFHFFRERLARELGFTFHEISIGEFQKGFSRLQPPFDTIFLQPWFDIEIKRLQCILNRIARDNPRARIVFLDSYAPLDLRLAQHVDEHIAVYVKKHVFRNRGEYGKSTRGDTNLVDYYGRLYGLHYPEKTFRVPQGFLDKLVVGPSFATARYMLTTFVRSTQPTSRKREIDLHARLGGVGKDWYGRMREHATAKALSIARIRIAAGGVVSQRKYLAELQSSKICFSPFGYGEVCWRDYEAVMCGALLIKPDMGHVETDPDIFVPFESYVPVRWDFSDLEEKVKHFLKSEKERAAITHNAHSLIRSYLTNGGFLRHVRRIIETPNPR